MSIQSEITLLQNTKGEIRNAIMEKGVTVTSSDLFSTYPTRISQISMTPGDKDALFRSLIERTATSLVIPEGTEVIRYGAFNHYETLTSVTIPNTVTTICHGAFGGTKGITSIVIPNSVTTIEETAFSGSGLTSVTLPSSVTSIEGYTFSNCTSLASVTIPNSVTIIKQYAFENCTSLTSVNIPDSVASINRYAFTGCSNLASITFNSTTPPSLASHALDNTNNCPLYVPENSVQAYKNAWSTYASRIYAIPGTFAILFTPTGGGRPTEVELEDLSTAGTIVIGDVPSAIRNGASGTLEIGEGVTTIGMLAFSNCTGLTSVTIPSGVTTIQSNAFNSCSSLKTVSIPNTVTTISTALFGNCRSLTSITIPDSVTSIGNNVFVNCTSLTSIEIPSSVTSIGNSAFKGCTSLDYVTVNATTPPTLGTDTFLNTNACPILVVPESVDLFKTAWSAYADRITCEGVAYWKLLGGTCDTNESGYNTGYITNTYEDANPTSPTYGNTRTETVQDEVTCPTQVWELIGSECETDGFGKNTGYLVNVYEDVNPSSSTYGQQWTDSVQDEETCPIPVATTEFRRITDIQDVTEGKYLIVDTANNIALNASLITSTTSGTNGINAFGDYISVDITDDTIEATETTLNAAVDYDGLYLTWTYENSGTVYYLSPKNNTVPSPFNPNAASPTSEITPYDNYNGGFTFQAYGAIALFTNSSNNSKFRWQSTNTDSNFDNVALFKLVE